MTTLSSTEPQLTWPLDAIAAPHRPPISACDDDDGRPKYQVMRFQIVAPTTAAKTTVRPSGVVGAVMIPPTVSATLVDTSDPSKLKTAASASATRGLSARVATEVAIAFAAS